MAGMTCIVGTKYSMRMSSNRLSLLLPSALNFAKFAFSEIDNGEHFYPLCFYSQQFSKVRP